MLSRKPAEMILALFLSVGAVSSTASASSVVQVPSQYTTIQAGIDAAAYGDVVVVAKGRYKECINFKGKAITVRSTDPTDRTVVAATVIDGGKTGSVVTFDQREKATTVLSGFTITNGSGTYHGAGVMDGGGVFCYVSSPTLTNNTITGNSVSSWYNGGHGGGVFCEGSSPSLTDNTIRDNSAQDGGGVYCYYSSPTLTNNSISGNSATGSSSFGDGGGGVDCCSHSSPKLTGNTIRGNSAQDGGGVRCCDHSSPNLTNNTISGNSASEGGGVYSHNSQPIIKDTIVALNTGGGGLTARCDAEQAPLRLPVVTYCDFYGNLGGNFVNFPDPTGTNGNLSANPLFAAPGKGDYRLKSTVGRWNGTAWVKDAISSPCIDAGDPKSDFSLESAPNGERVNMGYDGNTAQASKTSPPTVTATTPTSPSASAELPTITATFSTTMNKTAAQNAFSISPAQATGVAHGWPGTFSWVGNTMQYKLSTSLAKTRTYTVKIAKTAKSSAGVAMAAEKTWTFKTNGQPAVMSYAPTGAAVPRSTSGKVIKIVFNQAMNKASVEGALWVNRKGAAPSATPTRPPGVFTWVGNEMRYTLTNKLSALTYYTVKLGTGAKSWSGVARTTEFKWSFTTGGASTSPSTVTVASAPTAAGAQITLNLSSAAGVTVSIRNLAGREVAVLQPGELAAGVQTLLWNGQSRMGTKVPAGVYLLQVSAHAADGASTQALTSLQLR